MPTLVTYNTVLFRQGGYLEKHWYTSAVLDRRPNQLRKLVPSPPTDIHREHSPTQDYRKPEFLSLVGFDKSHYQDNNRFTLE